ncbi:MAG: discoidin domain-containing protein [Lentilactobacillus diolivorans]|nr:discoidin domain-containing protein [Lentilactobacillus diolivorans]
MHTQKQAINRIILTALGILLLAITFITAPKVSASGENSFALTGNIFINSTTQLANNVKLHWQVEPGADHYVIDKSVNGTDFNQIQTTTATTTDDNHVNEGAVFYRIRAFNNNNQQIGQSNVIKESIQQDITLSDSYSNTGISQFHGKNAAFKVNGIYYRYKLTGENHKALLEEASSTDGTHFADFKPVTIKNDSELGSCKIESVSIEMHNGVIIIWGHYENATDYSLGRMICISGKPGHPFIDHGSFRPKTPDGTEYQSRDLSFFADPNGKDAYLISAASSQSGHANQNTNIYKLNSDWTGIDPQFNPIIANQGLGREAPSMIKKDNWYYLFTSKANGWYPSEGGYNSATSIAGLATSKLQPIGNTSGYGAQSGGVGQLSDQPNSPYFMMANRWSAGWKYPDPAINNQNASRLFLVDMDNGFAAFDYYPTVKYDVDKDQIVPVQNGETLSVNKPAGQVAGDTPAVKDRDPQKANDGIVTDSANAYQPQTTNGQYNWTVDLGKSYLINEVDISFRYIGGSETYSKYLIQGSNDGKNFTTIKDNTQNRIIGFNENMISSSNGYRYIRLKVLGTYKASDDSLQNWAAGFNELTVYGSTDPTHAEISTPSTPGQQSVATVTPSASGSSSLPSASPSSSSSSIKTTSPSATPSETKIHHIKPFWLYLKKSTYLYNSATFHKSNRIKKYHVSSRIFGPTFKVVATAKPVNGLLKYRLSTGYYITANPKYVANLYWQHFKSKLIVINPDGVNGYASKNLTKKEAH